MIVKAVKLVYMLNGKEHKEYYDKASRRNEEINNIKRYHHLAEHCFIRGGRVKLELLNKEAEYQFSNYGYIDTDSFNVSEVK